MSMTEQVKRLTEFSPGAGCACKLGPGELAAVLAQVTPASHPDLLVGTDTGDDAAVWRLDDRRALVASVDFFTPLVDDARTWGWIAAVNAASDIWAMGGRPLFALSVVAWPRTELSPEILVEVLEGGAAAAAAGGWVVVGGHTVDDPVPKYGQAVIGEVDPARILTNAGLRPGDELVLTKAIGTGIACTAVKRGLGTAEAAIDSMMATNAAASVAALEAGATGATDVTGFGLLGHLAKMARASGVDVALDSGMVPLLPEVSALAASGCVPGGTLRNLEWVRDCLDIAPTVGEDTLVLLADAQTSGGLLFGAEPGAAGAAVAQLRTTGHPAAVIGRVSGAGEGRIAIR
ncbi:MAG: selenide, water dikinase SelD [Acidimicrobiales bacterium]